LNIKSRDGKLLVTSLLLPFF